MSAKTGGPSPGDLEAVRRELSDMSEFENEDEAFKNALAQLTGDEKTLARFLRARGMDVSKAKVAILETARWRADTRPEEINVDNDTEMRAEIDKGRVLACGPDHDGRLVLIIRVREHNAHDRDLAAMKRFVIALLEHSSCYEDPRLTVVFDQSGMGKKQLDSELRDSILGDVQAHYPERLAKVYMCNSPFIFRAVWKVVKPMLDPVTSEKVSMLGGKYEKKLIEVIDPSLMPKSIGGERTDEECIVALYAILGNACSVGAGVTLPEKVLQ